LLRSGANQDVLTQIYNGPPERSGDRQKYS
jgi:hypothetical protein